MHGATGFFSLWSTKSMTSWIFAPACFDHWPIMRYNYRVNLRVPLNGKSSIKVQSLPIPSCTLLSSDVIVPARSTQSLRTLSSLQYRYWPGRFYHDAPSSLGLSEFIVSYPIWNRNCPMVCWQLLWLVVVHSRALVCEDSAAADGVANSCCARHLNNSPQSWYRW